jgi:hypothetical protein
MRTEYKSDFVLAIYMIIIKLSPVIFARVGLVTDLSGSFDFGCKFYLGGMD